MPQGIIELADADSCMLEESDNDDMKGRRTFTITTNDRVYYCAADSRGEAETWVSYVVAEGGEIATPESSLTRRCLAATHNAATTIMRIVSAWKPTPAATASAGPLVQPLPHSGSVLGRIFANPGRYRTSHLCLPLLKLTLLH
jgi:hypothetical protein